MVDMSYSQEAETSQTESSESTDALMQYEVEDTPSMEHYDEKVNEQVLFPLVAKLIWIDEGWSSAQSKESCDAIKDYMVV